MTKAEITALITTGLLIIATFAVSLVPRRSEAEPEPLRSHIRAVIQIDRRSSAGALLVGYNYFLLESYAEHNGQTVEIRSAGRRESWIDSLKAGKADMVAMARPLMAEPNLLKNAFVHNTDGGRIVVTFADDCFTIANTGVDTPLDATRIFEPFYKGSKQEGSTGLGLSIADGICKLSGLTISYAHRDRMHCFTITRRTTPSHKA